MLEMERGKKEEGKKERRKEGKGRKKEGKEVGRGTETQAKFLSLRRPQSSSGNKLYKGRCQ